MNRITYMKQSEEYATGIANIVRLLDMEAIRKDKMSLETISMRDHNNVFVGVTGVSFEASSDWWMAIRGYEHKDGRTYERGTQINREQLGQLITFLNGIHSKMRDIPMYPATGTAPKKYY